MGELESWRAGRAGRAGISETVDASAVHCFYTFLGISWQALRRFSRGFQEVITGFSGGFQGVFGTRKGFSGFEVSWKWYVFIHPGLAEIVPSSPFIILKGEIEVKTPHRTRSESSTAWVVSFPSEDQMLAKF